MCIIANLPVAVSKVAIDKRGTQKVIHTPRSDGLYCWLQVRQKLGGTTSERFIEFRPREDGWFGYDVPWPSKKPHCQIKLKRKCLDAPTSKLTYGPNGPSRFRVFAFPEDNLTIQREHIVCIGEHRSHD